MEIIFDTSNFKRKTLESALTQFNYSKYEKGDNYNFQRKKVFGFYVYDNQEFIGGVYGWIDHCNWIWLDLLFVQEKHRGKDVATRLLQEVEKFGKSNNVIGLKTETWSFQALDFYKKFGFEVYGQLDDYPLGATDYCLKKKLI